MGAETDFIIGVLDIDVEDNLNYTSKMKWEMTEDEKIERRRLQKEARDEGSREWRKANPGYARAKYLEGYVRYMLARARNRAKTRGVPFDLEETDIVIPDICPVLGIPIIIGGGKQGPSDNSPCLDRMHGHEGYVRGNVCVISGRANILKRDGTPEELRKVADWVEANQF